VHEPKRVTGHLQHCQPGTGKAALFADTGRFLTMDKACLSATLSAFSSPWAGRFTTVHPTDLIPLDGRALALKTRPFRSGLTLVALDAATER
jgi:hypothetical protein